MISPNVLKATEGYNMVIEVHRSFLRCFTGISSEQIEQYLELNGETLTLPQSIEDAKTIRQDFEAFMADPIAYRASNFVS